MTSIHQGFVLNQRYFRESDLIVSIYTLEKGKVELVVRGGKKVLSKLRPGIELMNWVEIMMAPGKNFSYLASVNPLSSWPQLRTDLRRLSLGLSTVELLDKITVEMSEKREVYYLLQEWFKWLNSNDYQSVVGYISFYYLALKWLSLLGYGLPSNRCNSCSNKLQSDEFYLSLQGLFCQKCSRRGMVKLSLDSLARLYELDDIDSVASVVKFVNSAKPELNRESVILSRVWLQNVIDNELQAIALFNN